MTVLAWRWAAVRETLAAGAGRTSSKSLRHHHVVRVTRSVAAPRSSATRPQAVSPSVKSSTGVFGCHGGALAANHRWGRPTQTV